MLWLKTCRCRIVTMVQRSEVSSWMLVAHNCRVIQLSQELNQSFPQWRHNIGWIVQSETTNESDSNHTIVEIFVVEGNKQTVLRFRLQVTTTTSQASIQNIVPWPQKINYSTQHTFHETTEAKGFENSAPSLPIFTDLDIIVNLFLVGSYAPRTKQTVGWFTHNVNNAQMSTLLPWQYPIKHLLTMRNSARLNTYVSYIVGMEYVFFATIKHRSNYQGIPTLGIARISTARGRIWNVQLSRLSTHSVLHHDDLLSFRSHSRPPTLCMQGDLNAIGYLFASR
jgi:hypothetical protein